MLRCQPTHPTETAPPLVLPRTEGGIFNLQAQLFAGHTLLLFHKGLACDVCHLCLAKLAVLLKRRRYPNLRVVLISAENAAIASQYRSLLGESQLIVLHSLPTHLASAWGVAQPGTHVPKPTAIVVNSTGQIVQRCFLSNLTTHLPRLAAIQATLQRLQHRAAYEAAAHTEPSGAARSLHTRWQRPHTPPASGRSPHGGCYPATYGVPPSPC